MQYLVCLISCQPTKHSATSYPGLSLRGRILGPAASPLCSGSLGCIFLMSHDTPRSIVAPGNSTAGDMMLTSGT